MKVSKKPSFIPYMFRRSEGGLTKRTFHGVSGRVCLLLAMLEVKVWIRTVSTVMEEEGSEGLSGPGPVLLLVNSKANQEVVKSQEGQW